MGPDERVFSLQRGSNKHVLQIKITSMSIIEELKVIFRDAMLNCESVKYVENDKWRVDCLFWVFPGLYSIYVINKNTGKMASIDNLKEYDSQRVYDEMCTIHGLA